jgi:sigma-E factor negative regulatory protein RseA
VNGNSDMTLAIREQLSAFVDGELSPAEAELFLKRVERDASLRQALDRYLVMSEALRSHSASGPSRDFAARVSQAIAKETGNPKQTAWQSLRPVTRWARPMAGGAVAASVLAAMLFVVPNFQGNDATLTARDSGTESGTTATIIPAEAVRAAQARQQAEMYPSDMPVLQVSNGGRLAGYVMAHSEYASPLGRRNVLTGLLAEEPAGEGPVLETELYAEPPAQTRVQVDVSPQR